MTIGKLGPVDPVPESGKIERPQAPARREEQRDSVALSNEAKRSGDLHRVVGVVRALSDVRQERVAEVKAKLEDPTYLERGEVTDDVAEKIMKLLLNV